MEKIKEPKKATNRSSLTSIGSSSDDLRSISRRTSMALHLPEIAEFFNDDDLNQILDRAKNDATKNKAKVKVLP